MDPHNNNNQYPIDYLNQIAPQQKRPGPSNKLLVIVAGVGGILALIVGMFMLLGSGSGPTDDMQRLAARMQSLQKISDTANENIKSSTLRGINSNLKILLTNANHDIAEPLSNNGVDATKLNPRIVAEEDASELAATLEDARLNAVYDNTYAREMSFQLATLSALMGDIYERTNSKSMKEFLVATDEDLHPIKKQLDEFNNTKN